MFWHTQEVVHTVGLRTCRKEEADEDKGRGLGEGASSPGGGSIGRCPQTIELEFFRVQLTCAEGVLYLAPSFSNPSGHFAETHICRQILDDNVLHPALFTSYYSRCDLSGKR
jgi:hypothetical protein